MDLTSEENPFSSSRNVFLDANGIIIKFIEIIMSIPNTYSDVSCSYSVVHIIFSIIINALICTGFTVLNYLATVASSVLLKAKFIYYMKSYSEYLFGEFTVNIDLLRSFLGPLKLLFC